MTGPAVPRLRSGLFWVDVGAERVGYDEDAGRLHLLSPVGAAVVDLLEGGSSIDETVAELAAASGRPTGQVGPVVAAVLESLAHEGLLEGSADGWSGQASSTA